MRKSLLSFSTTILSVIILSFAGVLRVSAQAATATWALTSNSNVAVTGNITGSNFVSAGVNTPSYAATGVSTSGWSTNNGIQLTDYYEYKITPATGNVFVMSGLSFIHQISQNNAWDCAVYYSTNNFATAGTQVGANFTTSTTAATFSQTGMSVSVASGTTLSIRVYAWDATSTTRAFRNRNFVITGSTCSAMAFTTQPATQSLCAGNTLTLTAAASHATSYQWKKGGVNIDGATSAAYTKNNITAADAGSYTVDAISCYTITSAAATITVSPSPTAVSATASSTAICSGSPINLTATATPNSAAPVTVLSENFNGALNSWTKINNSTGGTPANAAWTLRPNGYSYTTSATVTFNSNDNSQFYMSNSDAPGNGSTTATILQSPSFSTVGLTSASLSFYHYYRYYNGGESGKIEISTNGASWTTLDTYNSNTGAANNFAQETISLASYLNQPTVFIRFKYDATFDYYWAIDNVSVSGISSAAATYAWTSTPAGFTSALQNPSVTPSANTTYHVAVTNSYGCTVNASTDLVVVDPVTVPGTVSASATVCSGASGTLTLGTHTGTVIRWESSLDNFATAPTTIANATTSLNYTNLTVTTSYRAVVKSGSCASANSVAATITVDPATVAGTVSGSATVCSGSNSGTLTLGTHTGNIVRWESSTDGFSTVTNITNTTASQSYNNLTATTAYRAVVQSGSCASANSVAATITVNPASVGGTVSGSTTVCANSNSGSLTLSGYTGTISKWQSSDLADFSVGVLDIPNTSATLSYLNLAGTTYYRAVLTSGVCAPAFSSVAAITVDTAAVGGNVSGSATVCYGNNSGALTLSGYSGTILGWESSFDNFATAGIPVANTTVTLNYSNLTATVSYRAVIGNGTCPSVYSSVATVAANVNSEWLGTNSTSWNDAANWSCGIVPTTDVHVTITAVTNQPIVSSDAFANTLTMETGTTLTVQSGANLTIEGAVNGQGTALLTVENEANLIQVNDVVNTGNAVVKRNTNPLKRLDYTLWSSPVTGQNLLAFSPATVANRFYIYNPATDLYNSVTPSTTNFAEGTGYLIRTPNNFPTAATVWNGTFAGTLNNGDVNLAVTNNTYNAIGNPYPSAIDADAFIAVNGLTEALYFWRKTNNDLTTSYATYTLAGGAGTGSNTGGDPGLLVPNGVIMPGQGFIAKSTSTTLSFNNTMRSGNSGQFFRSSQIERNRIWLNLTGSEGVFSQTMVSYMTGATQDVDAAIDGLYFNDSQVALTSLIGTAEYAVQGRALPFANTDVVPLGFKAITAGTYTIGLDHADGLFADVSQPILLKDNTDGSTHDLREGNYTFAAEAGASNGRFELVYQTTLQTSNPQWDANQVVVYTRNSELFIHTGKLKMDKVEVYDVRGRLLVSKSKINANEIRLMPGTANQVLIVKIVSADQEVVTKKVVN